MFRDRTGNVLVFVLLLVAVTALAVGVGTAEPTEEESFFEVEITGTNAPVTEGETLVVNATVTNTGDTTDHQQIHLKDFDGGIVDSVAQPPLTLDPGERENVTLTWETELGDAGDGEFSVQSNDDFPRQSISIERGAEVTINETNLPITAGERLNVSVDVSTPRETLETTRVRLAIDGSVKDEKRSVLLYDETDQVELTWVSSEDYAGERTLTVSTAGHHEERQITIDTSDSSTSSNGNTGSTDTGDGTETSVSDSDPPTSIPDTEVSTSSSGPESSTDSGSSASQSDSESLTETDEQGTFGFVSAVLLFGTISVGSLVAYRLRA